MSSQASELTKKYRCVGGEPAAELIGDYCPAKLPSQAAHTKQPIGPDVSPGSGRNSLVPLTVLP